MMRIQASTKYALRVMQCICKCENKKVSAKELSEELSISYLYIMKILGALRESSIIISIQGCQGGFRLNRRPQEITVLDVFTAIEGDVNLYAVQPEEEQSKEELRIRGFFDTIERTMVHVMHKTTLEELFEINPKPIRDVVEHNSLLSYELSGM